MKLTAICLLAAGLAAMVVALPPPARDRELPPGAYWEGDTLVLNPLEGRDYPAEDDHSHKHINSGVQGNFSGPWDNLNFTSRPDVGDTSAIQFADSVVTTVGEIRLGGAAIHVGTLRLKRLEEAIYQCLTYSCPLYDSTREMNPCTPGNTWEPCTVHNIVFDKDRKPEYKSDGKLEIYTLQAFHNPRWQGLGEAIYRTVAKAYSINADQDSACRYADFPRSRRTKLCSGPRRASAAFPVNDDDGNTSEVQALAAIELKFVGPQQTDGNSDPARNGGTGFKDIVREQIKTYYGDSIAKAVGRDAADIDFRVSTDIVLNCEEWFWFKSKGNCKGG